MARRNLLDPSVPEQPKGASVERCGICDRSPAFLCPTCPKRAAGPDRFDHGWSRARENDQEMAEIQHLDAKLARQLATTHESHSAYPALLASYENNGARLAALYERRRQERFTQRGTP